VNTTRELPLLQLLLSVPSRSSPILQSRALQASWRAGRGDTGELRAAFHPAVWTEVLLKKRCRGAHESEQGRIRATGTGAQPNQRLKLAAPVPNGSRERFTCGVVEFHL